jgi:hypothetical protein
MRPGLAGSRTVYLRSARMHHRLLLALLIAALVAAPALAQAPNPPPPVATTSTATGIGLTTATVPGSVDANGAATTYHVEYGTTTSYGLATPDRNAGAGDAPVAISVGLSGLTSDTTYHVRVVATNAAGIGRSADRTLRTTRPPQPLSPLATTAGVRELTARSATVTGSVNPRGTATRYQFDYGTGSNLNRRTALVAAGAGTTAVAASAALALTPNTRYSYRMRATSPAGTVLGARKSFTSARARGKLTFALQANRVPYQGTAVITGIATSGGAGGVTVALERQPFPFAGSFMRIASTRSASDGSYRFAVTPLLLSARLRAVASTVPAVTSIAHTVRTTVRVGFTVSRVSHRRLRFFGAVVPVSNGSRASVQRRVRGHFRTLRRTTVRSDGAAGSSYAVTIAARRSAATYRVIVTPRTVSGNARGTSRLQTVRGLAHR